MKPRRGNVKMASPMEREEYEALAQASVEDIGRMSAFIDAISENPGPLFESALERLVATCAYADDLIQPPETVSLVFENTPGYYAGTDRRSGTITIRRGVMSLFRDISELHCAYEALYAFDGSLVHGPGLTNEEIKCLVTRSARNFVRSEAGVWREDEVLRRCFLERTQRDKDERDTRQTATHFFIRLISLACFVVAHEVAHILHHGPSWNPLRRRKSSEEMELEADQVAAKWVLDYIHIPPTFFSEEPPVTGKGPFADMMALGFWYREQESKWRKGSLASLLEAVSQAGDAPNVVYTSEYEAARAVSVSVIALFFNVWGRVEVEARAMGLDFGRGYPSAAVRYENFREACHAHPHSPPEMFDKPNGRRGPLQTEYELFRNIFGEVAGGP